MLPRLLPDTRLIPSEHGVVICGPRHTAAIGSPALYSWIEQLRPFLDGARNLDELLADLPPEVATQVGGVIDLLVREGFVRDAAGDEAHALSPAVRARHAAMIDFIEQQSPDSPEWRFERYRRCAPVVVGSGWLPCAVALALLATGVEFVRLHTVAVTEGEDTSVHVERLVECAGALLRDEPGARLECSAGGFDSGRDADSGSATGSVVDAAANAATDSAFADAGALLFCADAGGAPALAMAERVEALARRSDVAFGRILVADDRAFISPVSRVTAAEDAAFIATNIASESSGVSPYLAGPTASLAAHQLCLHLLSFTADLTGDHDAAELDLATARFDRVRAW